jgi:hypothetical protein
MSQAIPGGLVAILFALWLSALATTDNPVSEITDQGRSVVRELRSQGPRHDGERALADHMVTLSTSILFNAHGTPPLSRLGALPHPDAGRRRAINYGEALLLPRRCRPLRRELLEGSATREIRAASPCDRTEPALRRRGGSALGGMVRHAGPPFWEVRERANSLLHSSARQHRKEQQSG